MFRRVLVLATALCMIAAPVHAQFVVIDPANLVQTTLIAYRVQQHYTELRAQYLTVLRMAQRLGSLDRFRTPPIALTSHDPSRWDFGRPWIQALNSGDPTGSAYFSTALPLLRPTIAPPTLSAAARQMLQRQYATVEITDSVATMGGHQVALARGYHGQLQNAVESLQNDVLNPGSQYHEMTAILDKIAEEIGEFRAALKSGDKAKIADELGDLIFAAVNIGRHVGVEPEMAVRGTNTKFRRRFSYIETALEKNGESLDEATLDRMEELWQEAKGR